MSGLTASGLVLTDNGGDSLTVASGATTFTFATKLSSGASYDVAVATQPTGETCKVSSSATGTVSGNESSVSVTCSGSSFSISGTVSGLTTAGLKLKDYSGGETVSVAAGAASFQFSQSVPYDTNVDVTVATQPFWQACTAGASNFSGPITSNLTTETFSCAGDTANVTTFAGSTTSGSTNGTGTSASFYGTAGVAMDSSGHIYVADTNNNEIREISPAGVVTTLAGSTTAGHADGTGSAASFDAPTSVAVDSAGNVYVADSFNNEIRKIAPGGIVTTFAGSTNPGAADGTGSAASFRNPEGVAVDSSGNLYVADSLNNEIRMITPAALVTTFAGSVTAGSANGSSTSASFNGPTGVAVDSSGNLYVADHNNNEIRMINLSDVVSTLAGSTTAGSADGTGSAASFDGPTAVAVDSAGDVYVADSGNNEIRLVSPLGVVTTLAGSTVAGSANGIGSAASFDSPDGIAVSPSGQLFVGDFLNNEIRQLTP
ncbi:MAG: hypothetical protein ACREUL_10105 [Steroidobacteraceae bacterium]